MLSFKACELAVVSLLSLSEMVIIFTTLVGTCSQL